MFVGVGGIEYGGCTRIEMHVMNVRFRIGEEDQLSFKVVGDGKIGE